jgi:hypothetical protein
MSRQLFIGLTLLAGAFVAGNASAQQSCEPVHGHGPSAFHTDFYRNNRWPLPFRNDDAASVLNYFDVQRNNGWKLNNTLGNAMFEPSTNALTQAGIAHMRWIVQQAPLNRRVVFVLVGNNQQQTAARVESTQLAISELIPTGALPAIYLTDRDSPGSSGAYQAAVVNAFTQSLPSPRLTSGGGTP